MNSDLKISVYITVKNMENTLERAITSVLDQDYSNIELIIHDGGSTDGTLKIIEKYRHRINILDLTSDQGPDYNTGLELYTGDVLAFLNADDWYEENLFSVLAKKYVEFPNADLFTCYGRVVTLNQNQQIDKIVLQYDKPGILKLNTENIFNGVSAIGCRFFSRKILSKIGFFYQYDENRVGLQSNDKEWLYRLSLLNPTDIIIEQLGHNYLFHSGSQSFNNDKRKLVLAFKDSIRLADYILNDYKNMNQNDKKIIFNWKLKTFIRIILYELLIGSFVSGFKDLMSFIKQYKFLALSTFAKEIVNQFIRKIKLLVNKYL